MLGLRFRLKWRLNDGSCETTTMSFRTIEPLVINVPTSIFIPCFDFTKANELSKLKYCISDYLFIICSFIIIILFLIRCVVNVLVSVLYDGFSLISYFSLNCLENELDNHVITIKGKGRWPFKKCFDSARACLIWRQLWPTVTSSAAAAAAALYRAAPHWAAL